ncbi:MAG: exopolysaccharide biosynthesis polyprenyl glycosylphosphotransferase [Verrucomicrobia bacterium]|nr:exopolysaccharide biosynthesis polyprenyl glycosylphosphotransferase [Verrucomicrobiota bacterium]
MPRASTHSLRETVVPLVLLAGDTALTFAGLAFGWWLRYASPLARLGIDVPDATFRRYLPLLLVGVALLVGAFAQFGLYDSRLLLRRYLSLNAILKGAAFWLVAYLGVSLVLKFDPPISRLFVIEAFVCVIVLLAAWRQLAYAVLTHSALLGRLRRRAVLLGWNDDARALAQEVARDPAHPFVLVGVVTVRGDTSAFAAARPDRPPELGSAGELGAILARESPDLLIATRLDLPREEIRRIVETCEQAYVEWKIVPGAFDIFLSGLRLQTIGRVPVLGVEELAINRLFNRGLKRVLDLSGAVVGLVLSLPVGLVLAALIKRESPGGAVLFRQTRVGAGHRPFTLWKLRSMAPDADAADAAQQSTARDDPRLLRIGAFMRRWNLDELPQFWNILRGDMSLVGPRPERPYHVDQLAGTIPHYLPRHLVKPGLTGWAQVNGLRGDSDLTLRVQHDIFYIENWSLWLDAQIILLTFVRWRHPSAY